MTDEMTFSAVHLDVCEGSLPRSSSYPTVSAVTTSEIMPMDFTSDAPTFDEFSDRVYSHIRATRRKIKPHLWTSLITGYFDDHTVEEVAYQMTDQHTPAYYEGIEREFLRSLL